MGNTIGAYTRYIINMHIHCIYPNWIPFSVSGTVSAGLVLEHVLHRTSDLEDSAPQFANEWTVHCDTLRLHIFKKA